MAVWYFIKKDKIVVVVKTVVSTETFVIEEYRVRISVGLYLKQKIENKLINE